MSRFRWERSRDPGGRLGSSAESRRGGGRRATIPDVTGRLLTTRHLNRALLARQLLLERSDLPLERALESCAGLQTQYAPSGYVGLWSRLRDFRRAGLTEALERRSAVQATLMRSTIHVVSAPDFHPFAAAIRQGRREGWLRVAHHRLEGADMAAVAELARAHLAGRPRRAADIKALLADHGIPAIAGSGLGLWVDLVRVPPSGTWERRRADLFGLAEEWLGSSAVSREEGLQLLVRRYLGGFGPASLADIASWTGLAVTALRPVVERVATRAFRDERGTVLVDLPDAPLPDPDTPAPVRFLPTWDATLLVHARRTQVLPDAYRARVFHVRTPHSVPTFLVDGQVAGTWREAGGAVRLEPFHPLSPGAMAELEEEARRLGAFMA